MVVIYFLRHAQTDYNANAVRIGGRSNAIELSKMGHEQARLRGEWFANWGEQFDAVFCSSAVRAKQTLAHITERVEITKSEVFYTDQLNETGQGEWEGKYRSEVITPKVMEQIIAESPHFRAPGGESHKEAEERMYQFVKEHILDSYDSGRFLLVGHGLSFKCLLQGILGLNPKMTYYIGIDNASLTRLRYDKEKGWRLDYLNRII